MIDTSGLQDDLGDLFNNVMPTCSDGSGNIVMALGMMQHINTFLDKLTVTNSSSGATSTHCISLVTVPSEDPDVHPLPYTFAETIGQVFENMKTAEDGNTYLAEELPNALEKHLGVTVPPIPVPAGLFVPTIPATVIATALKELFPLMQQSPVPPMSFEQVLAQTISTYVGAAKINGTDTIS